MSDDTIPSDIFSENIICADSNVNPCINIIVNKQKKLVCKCCHEFIGFVNNSNLVENNHDSSMLLCGKYFCFNENNPAKRSKKNNDDENKNDIDFQQDDNIVKSDLSSIIKPSIIKPSLINPSRLFSTELSSDLLTTSSSIEDVISDGIIYKSNNTVNNNINSLIEEQVQENNNLMTWLQSLDEKNKMSIDTMQLLLFNNNNDELRKLKRQFDENKITIHRILSSTNTTEDKMFMLEKYQHMNKCEEYSEKWYEARRIILSTLHRGAIQANPLIKIINERSNIIKSNNINYDEDTNINCDEDINCCDDDINCCDDDNEVLTILKEDKLKTNKKSKDYIKNNSIGNNNDIPLSLLSLLLKPIPRRSERVKTKSDANISADNETNNIKNNDKKTPPIISKDNIDELIEYVKIKKWKTEVKENIIAHIEQYETADRSECSKLKTWINYAIHLPDEVKPPSIYREDSSDKIHEYTNLIRQTLNKNIYGMEEAKEEILEFILHRIGVTNKDQIVEHKKVTKVLLLCGPPGIGKTEISRSLAECLELPMIKIALGGINDSSALIGHSFTYTGAMPGRIIRGLTKCKYLNSIIFFDEIDKTSNRHNDEVNGVLTHLIDETQNMEFVDEYMEFPVDMSNCLYICAANDIDRIDPIVRDRMDVIMLKGYTKKDKMNISKLHLIPSILKEIGFKPEEIVFSDEAINAIISEFSNDKIEKGVRGLRRQFVGIIKRLNAIYLTGNKYAECALLSYDGLPHLVSKKDIDILKRIHDDNELPPSTLTMYS